MDNIKTKTTEHGNYNYGYDDLYRLTKETRPGIADDGKPMTDDFLYDQVGNRLQG